MMGTSGRSDVVQYYTERTQATTEVWAALDSELTKSFGSSGKDSDDLISNRLVTYLVLITVAERSKERFPRYISGHVYYFIHLSTPVFEISFVRRVLPRKSAGQLRRIHLITDVVSGLRPLAPWWSLLRSMERTPPALGPKTDSPAIPRRSA